MKNEEYSRPQLNRIRLVESLFRGSAVRNSTGQAEGGKGRKFGMMERRILDPSTWRLVKPE